MKTSGRKAKLKEKTMEEKYTPLLGEAFHIHTKRCGHASGEDREYIEKAIELGAPRIVFTDHAPFPGNPFRNRMLIEELTEYIETFRRLKEEYVDKIEIMTGLECEYLPGFHNYYEELKGQFGLDLLILGQHFYEKRDGTYNFTDSDRTGEYQGICEALVAGIETGLFAVAAHPDRGFKREKEFPKSVEQDCRAIIQAASEKNVWLEQNYASICRKRNYRPEFWALVPKDAKLLYGIDAHSVAELEKGWKYKYSEE